jgi:hypothetical protein
MIHPFAATTGSSAHTHQSPTTHTPFEVVTSHPIAFFLSPCLSSGRTNYHLSDHDLLLLPGAAARVLCSRILLYSCTDRQQNMWEGISDHPIYYCLLVTFECPSKWVSIGTGQHSIQPCLAELTKQVGLPVRKVFIIQTNTIMQICYIISYYKAKYETRTTSRKTMLVFELFGILEKWG